MTEVFRVAALITTYNSERFIEGRFTDLINQTLWQSGQLEIALINSASKQGEDTFALEFIESLPYENRARFHYIRTPFREGMYRAWNRAIDITSAPYLTNANMDDRLRPDALEKLADTLSRLGDDFVGVYGDHHVTSTPNAVWGGDYQLDRPSYYPEGNTCWPQAIPEIMANRCVIGPSPMWKRTAHVTCGKFDETYILAGDYDMWLRFMEAGLKWHKLDETIGLFYHHPMQQSQSNLSHIVMETRRTQLAHPLRR